MRKLAKRPGVEPDTFSFNQVLAALGRKGSAKMAEELLLYMDRAYQTDMHPKAKPESESYVHVIQAYTRSGQKGGAVRAERLLRHMKERYFEFNEKHVKPNRNVYNAVSNSLQSEPGAIQQEISISSLWLLQVIDCWAKSGEGTLGARKAEALLQEMQDLQAEYHDESLAPNLVTFNSLLNAWALSGTRCCGHKAEKYLDQMWKLYNAGDNDLVKPNDKTYNTVSGSPF